MNGLAFETFCLAGSRKRFCRRFTLNSFYASTMALRCLFSV